MGHRDPSPDGKVIRRSSSGDRDVPAYSSETSSEAVYHYDDSRKLGVTSAVFLILNKMIGTGSTLVSGVEPGRNANSHQQFSPRRLESTPPLAPWA